MRLDPRVKERIKKTFLEEVSAGKSVVRLTCAYSLSQDEQKQIIAQFPQFAGFSIECVIDPTIIGGFVLQQGSQAIDLSIRSVLQTLHKSFV